MRIVLVGNHGVDYSTETHYRRTLEAMGHEVIPLQETATTGEQVEAEARQADLLVVSHSHGWRTPGKPIFEVLQDIDTPSMSYHLDVWLGLEREKDLTDDPFYSTVDHFFTVDRNMVDKMSGGHTQWHYLPAGVFDQECILYDEPKTRDVIFVGSRGYHPEWPYRPQLIDWLRTTFGDQFEHYGGDGLGVVRGLPLNHLYGSTKVVVGDSLNLGFQVKDYWSDRVYETLGRGGFLIHPRVEGMEHYFDDWEHLVFYEYGDFEQLEHLIRYFLDHDEDREIIRRRGHEHVKAHHTYRHRWATVLDTLGVS